MPNSYDAIVEKIKNTTSTRPDVKSMNEHIETLAVACRSLIDIHDRDLLTGEAQTQLGDTYTALVLMLDDIQRTYTEVIKALVLAHARALTMSDDIWYEAHEDAVELTRTKAALIQSYQKIESLERALMAKVEQINLLDQEIQHLRRRFQAVEEDRIRLRKKARGR